MTAVTVSTSRTLRSLLLRRRPRRRTSAVSRVAVGDGSFGGEQYRLLALHLATNMRNRDQKTIALFRPTARVPGTSIALNLAAALAQHVEVVVLSTSPVDRELLDAAALLAERSHRVTGQVISESQVPARIDDVTDASTFVLVDSPPADRSSGAYHIAQAAKHVLYLLPENVHELDTHERNVRQLRRLQVNVLGVLLCGG